MEINKREVDSVAIIDIIGEVDLYNAKEVKDVIEDIIKNGKYQLIINLAQVPFMDSSGIGTLVTGMYRLKKFQGGLKIINTVGSVAKVFKMTGMDAHLEVYDSEAKAVKSFIEDL